MRYFLLLLFLVTSAIYGQQVIKDLTVNDLKVVSTTKGSKPCPLMTQTQINAIVSPLNGQCAYNTTTNKLNVYNGSLWKAAGGGVDSWATASVYAVNDLVIESNKIYKCLIAHTSGTFATDLAASRWVEVSAGVSDHTLLTNIGTNSHAQIDTALTRLANTSGTNTGDQDLSTLVTLSTGQTISGLKQFSNSVGIGGAANANAVLDVQSTTKAFLPPRMTTTQKNAISSPVAGMMVFDITASAPAVYNGTSWDTYVANNGTPHSWTDFGVFTADTTVFGMGTLTGTGSFPCKYKRLTNEVEVRCDFTGGTNSGAIGAFLLPASLTIDSAQIIRSNTTSNPGVVVGRWSTNGGNTLGNIVTATGTSTNRVYMGGTFNNAAMLTPQVVSSFVASGAIWSVYFKVPVSGW
jgi:hypothetical protein